MKLLVVVASEGGHTRALAEAFREGAAAEGAEVEIAAAASADSEALLGADGLVLGSAVHMGGVSSEMRAFFERTAPFWLSGRLVGRIGAAFASAGLGDRGGAELTLVALHAFLAEHGFLCVSMPRTLAGFADAGCHWGPAVTTSGGIDPRALEALRAHGGHVAACTARWLAGRDPSG